MPYTPPYNIAYYTKLYYNRVIKIGISGRLIDFAVWSYRPRDDLAVALLHPGQYAVRSARLSLFLVQPL